MSQNRTQILQMLADGKVSVDEAERLLSLVDEPDAGRGAARVGPARAKHLRVVVEPNTEAGEDSEGDRVNVRVPMALLRAGMRFTALLPSIAEGPIDRALKDKGLDLDLRSIKPEHFEDLVDALRDLEVDVENSKEKVRVYVE